MNRKDPQGRTSKGNKRGNAVVTLHLQQSVAVVAIVATGCINSKQKYTEI